MLRLPPLVRHGFFYALIYVGTGVSMPYAPVWFKGVGLTAPQIGMILAAPMLGRAVAGPATAVWAEGFRLRRTPILLLALIAAACYAALLLLHGFFAWLLLWFVAATAISAISPLADVLNLIRSRIDNFTYTLARSIGSIGYIFGNIAGGAVVAATSPVTAIIWPAVAATACAVLGLKLLPAEPTQHPSATDETRLGWSALPALLRNGDLMLCIAVFSLIQGSHGLYYGFSAIAWTAQGVPAWAVGVLWGVSVGAEVGLFWMGGLVRKRFDPTQLILIGAVAAVIRWTALAFSPPLWLLFPLQALHALTFTATFMGGLELVDRLCPRSQASAAQTLSASLSYGLATGATTVAGGWLYARFGAGAYLPMSVVALIGAIGALVLSRRVGASGRNLTQQAA
eukprot:gene18741-19045_t